LPKPRLYIVDDPAPNAFSTGRNPKHAAVAVTTGLLEKMNRVELEGVLAHELSHIRNYDVLVMTLAVTMVGIIILISDFFLRITFWTGGRGNRDNDNNNPLGIVFAILGFLLLIAAPIVASLMQFAVSRRREYLADVSGVQMTRYPPGLISALKKLEDDHTSVHTSSKATAHLWIEEPLDKESNKGHTKWNHLFDTHPPIEDRIRELESM
jgi:heat shock protein HtpX